MPLGRIRAQPSCTVHVAHAHSASSARCTTRAARGLPGWPRPVRPTMARCSTARERTPERSPLSGRASQRGRWQHYSGGGGANDGARAPTAERLPAEHGGGGDRSPELLVDGEGEQNGSAAAFSDEARAPVADGGPAMGRSERISADGRREKRGGASALSGARTV
jgi:hypothetical protein